MKAQSHFDGFVVREGGALWMQYDLPLALIRSFNGLSQTGCLDDRQYSAESYRI